MASSSKLWPKGRSSLPSEVVEEEILGRIPIEDVIRFKPVCKQWYALFNNKRFIYKHLDLSQKWFIRIHRHKVQIINPVTLDLLSLSVPSEFFLGNRVNNSNFLLYVIHCDGLLLCVFGCGKYHRKLAVWNPVLSSRVKWIEPSHAYNRIDLYGFGIDSDNNYKILRFDHYRGDYEIYDFKSKLWRAFSATFNWKVYMPLRDVSMKGSMYWIAKAKSNSKLLIQSFDFSKETFKPICSSFPVEVRHDFVRNISLDIIVLSGFGGDRLSLLHQHHVGDDNTREIKIEVWVTNKVTDSAVSWTKYFNVTRPDLPILHPDICAQGVPTFFIHKASGIMLWCDRFLQEDEDVQEEDEEVKGVCPSFYEIGEGEIRKQVETGPRFTGYSSTCICGDLYVPSLVPFPE